ncbi:hypothetical protein CCR97_22230 [Rhodoplanes elegans]|uniref:Uncharacterized protein n=1 Tax=Rhodoplanes elegans TaxID=29408 RepID=A0A327KIL8_9BRAD|nr:hypothetical protein [Rhodoplanes elegans]MBK5960901.1 hypothetical protein [Rhodoplanes elegans]RAI38317.1 hypothetical protein CH338_13115 [Rhodoplanes elegans]
MPLSLVTSLQCCSGDRIATETSADARPIAVPSAERPFSITAGLAPMLRRTVTTRCTANPDCVIADRCAATPAMKQACAAAFQTWVRRGLAAEDAVRRPVVR